MGTAIGGSGLPALLDLRGRPDLYGRPLESTHIGLADELAAAASLAMGQADEGLPIVLARGAGTVRTQSTALAIRCHLRPGPEDEIGDCHGRSTCRRPAPGWGLCRCN